MMYYRASRAIQFIVRFLLFALGPHVCEIRTPFCDIILSRGEALSLSLSFSLEFLLSYMNTKKKGNKFHTNKHYCCMTALSLLPVCRSARVESNT